MEKQLKELERKIDIENVNNYLRFRLTDTKDLLATLKPYADGTKETKIISRSEA